MSTNVAPLTRMLLGTDNKNGTFTGVTSGTSIILPPDDHTLTSMAFIGNGTISGGTAVIEEAYCSPDSASPYTGTWSTIYTLTATAVTGGAQLCAHIAPSSLYSRRVRITSNITGGGGLSVAARVQ